MTVTVNVASGNSYVGILNHFILQSSFETSVDYNFPNNTSTVRWNLAFDFSAQAGGETRSYGAMVRVADPLVRNFDGSFSLFGVAFNPNIGESVFVSSSLFVSGTSSTVTTFRTNNGSNMTVTDIADQQGSVNLFTAQPASGLTSFGGFNIAAVEWNFALSAWNAGDIAPMRFLMDREQYNFLGASSFNTDTFNGGNLGDTIRGGGGHDFLYGNLGNDFLFGDADNDLISGGSGNDELTGGIGINQLQGGADDDLYILGAGADTISDSGGVDTVRFTNASRLNWADGIFTGDVANDTISEAQIERFSGSSGDDEIAISTLSTKSVYIYAGAGNDNLAGGGAADSIYGAEGNDVIGGRGGNDILDGGDGDDQLYAGEGNDTLSGGTGNDYLDGLTGADTVSFIDHFGAWSGGWVINLTAQSATTLHPGSGQFLYFTETDTLAYLENVIGSRGADTIIGDGSGNYLDGSSGIDSLSGLLGNDTYYVDNILDTVYETNAIGAGADLIYSSVTYTVAANAERLYLTGFDNINGTGRINFADVLTGNAGHNILNGLTGNDFMRGLQGSDTYIVDSTLDIIEELSSYGTDSIKSTASYTMALNTERLYLIGSGAIDGTGLNGKNDLIVGNNNANKLNGLTGNDTLTGGLGGDTFIFNTALNAATNSDTITDFNVAADTIQLENAIFTALGAATGVLASAMFKNLTTGGAVDADDRILYNDATGALFYDSDGSGAVAAIQFAVLSGSPTVFFDDFVVV